MKKFPRLLLYFLPLLLAACNGGEMRDTLGLNKDAPDEFTVISRPPLSVPPEFNLRPPEPGAPPRHPSTADTARSTLLGTTPAVPDATATSETPIIVPLRSGDTASPAAESILKRAGADAASSNIRTDLGTDAATPNDTSGAKSLYEKITGAKKADSVVDPKKEAERLRSNKDAGKPVTEGDVPILDEKPKSVIDKVF